MPHTAPGSRRPLADEETPLLGGGGGGHAPNPDGDNGRLHPAAGNGTANSSNGHGHGPSVDHQPNVCTTKAHLAHPYRSRHFVQAIVQFGLFVLALYMIVTPLSKLMEDFICRDMFPELIGVVVPGDAVDPRCKSAEVQGKLAKVTGTQLAIDNIPSESPSF